MKRTIKILSMTFLISLLSTLLSFSAQWTKNSNGKWTYVKDTGELLTKSWLYSNNHWYHFGDDGIMDQGWFNDVKTNKIYFLEPSENGGYVLTGWQLINGCYYHFGTDGVLDRNKIVEGKTVDDQGRLVINGVAFYDANAGGFITKTSINFSNDNSETNNSSVFGLGPGGGSGTLFGSGGGGASGSLTLIGNNSSGGSSSGSGGGSSSSGRGKGKTVQVVLNAMEGDFCGFKTNTISFAKDSSINKIKTVPKRKGYLFDCWYLDEERTKYAPYYIEKNQTFYAGYKEAYTIYYDAKGGTFSTGGSLTYEDVEKESELKLIDLVPTRNGYEFLYWCSDSACENKVEENVIVDSSKTFYAKWIKIITVTYNSGKGNFDNGKATMISNCLCGESIDEISEIPSWSSHTFIGWYKNVRDEESFDFSESLMADLVLNAKWEAYKLTFNAGTGKVKGKNIYEVDCNEEGYVECLEPVKAGFEFGGWYDSLEDDVVHDFTVVLEESKEVYAKWNPFQACFVLGDGRYENNDDAFLTVYVEDNGKVQKPTNTPKATGQIFVDWYKDEACTIKYDFSQVLTDDIDIYAKYKESIALMPTGVTIRDLLPTDVEKVSFIPESDITTNKVISLSNSESKIYYAYDTTTKFAKFYTNSYKFKLNSVSSNMFTQKTKITSIEGLEYFDTSSVTDMSSMFSNLTSVSGTFEVENWDTSKVTNFSSIFAFSGWTVYNIGCFSDEACTYASEMFRQLKNRLSYVDLSGFKKCSANINHMFVGTVVTAGTLRCKRSLKTQLEEYFHNGYAHPINWYPSVGGFKILYIENVGTPYYKELTPAYDLID